MNRRDFVLAAGATGLASSLPRRAASRGSRSRPNILLIMTDEHSAGVASAWMGNKYIKTPHLDSVIASGVTYDSAYCANPICVPARTAMLSGRYPTQSGVVDNSTLLAEASKPPASPPLGKVFRDQGYETAYFGKWHVTPPADLPALHGFHRMATTHNEDAAAAAGAVDFLRRKPQTPFLLVTSILDPHSICEWARGEHLPLGDLPEPPPPDQCPPAPHNLAPQEGEPDIMTLMRKSYHASPQFPVGDFTPEKWRQYLWAYYRLVERADARVGEVLGALRATGLNENTIIVFTSDHGDAQGAHGWNQKTVFYDESTRVPFVISRNGTKARTCDRLVNVGIDLIPTICDLAGIVAPRALPGHSVRNADHNPRRYIVASNRMSQGIAVDGQNPKPDGRMIRSRRYKYCAYSLGAQRESLVDLDSDPGETVNLAAKPQYQKVLSEHRAMLTEWCRQTGDSFIVPAS